MKDRITDIGTWLGAACALLFVLYFLASPIIFLNTTRGPAASPFLRNFSGPVVWVTESDFKAPMLWYFGLWGIGIDYFEREPASKPPSYLLVAYGIVALGTATPLGWPLYRWRLKQMRMKNRTRRLQATAP